MSHSVTDSCTVSDRLAPVSQAAATLFVVGTGLGGFGSIFVGASWITTPLVISAFMYAAIAALLIWFRRPRATGPGWVRAVVPWLVGAVVGLCGLTAAAAPGTALLGIIPTPSTVLRFQELTRTGLVDMASGVAPLRPDAGFSFLIAVAGVVIAFVSAALVLLARLPLVAILLAIAVYAAPQLVTVPALNDFSFAALGCAILLLLALTRHRQFDTERMGRLRPTAIPAAAVAVVVALIAAPTLTTTIAPSPVAVNAHPGPFESGINPLITLGEDLRRGSNTVALKYVTTAEDAPYLRVFTIDDLDRTLWQPRGFSSNPGATVDAFPSPPGLAAETSRTEISTTITIDSLSTNWLPMPYAPSSVEGLLGNWLWELPGLSAYSNMSTTRAQQYTVKSIVAEPTAEQLRAATPGGGSGVDERYRSLPDDLPMEIQDVLSQVVAGADTDYDRAMAMQTYFRDNFTYSEQAPVQKGFDGSAGEVIASFLERKTGYCVHFSSAMTVMSRLLGIPARIAVGYLPGTPDTINDAGDRTYRVTSQQLHAWPELYFEGAGWISFEPTTSRGAPAQFGAVAPTPSTAPTTAPTSVPTSAPTSAPTTSPTSAPTPSAGPKSPGANISALLLGPEIILGAILALALLCVLVVPALLRRWQRGRGFARGARTGTPAGAVWTELNAVALDLGIEHPHGETSREFAARLGEYPGVSADHLAHLIGALDAESYRRPASSTQTQDANPQTPRHPSTRDQLQTLTAGTETIRALRAAQPARVRLRAFFLPRSLRRH
ncbi:transglutaminaseTgpA domain-containing protein [Mycetocola sp. JXN-3]|uniref:transglutaminaseTgpA domain-containing protein n=1 Tax=Mycetocola sp. JXN-3 TaxID=2116510 RepID=UPI00165D1DFD|nr:transglutaminaseTgpA domain-containing protein [Mycetocola sp. JXN-3]